MTTSRPLLPAGRRFAPVGTDTHAPTAGSSLEMLARGFAQQNSDRPKVLTPHLLPSPISSTDFVLLGKAQARWT